MAKKALTKKSSSSEKSFIVIGIGASAGGVKAIQDFFAAMPADSGMAFVVILHLSPEHESNLAEIIQSQTAMPVTVVNETKKVEPNHVYVIPPNKHLEMVDGIVRATQPKEDGSRVAIDVFFRTLAENYRENAVCVVLSGTGTDGTLGLKAIKGENGFAVVQAPHDAEYDSMPRSAIATQLADWILPVAAMPEKLLLFRDSSKRLHLTSDKDAKKVAEEIHADESLREILTVLRVRTGHDFSNYKTPTLIRRIARHLQIHNLEDIPSYLEFLRAHPDEISSLLKNLLINVTSFFRDKEAWAVIEREVIPRLFEGKRSSEVVRVWSCACASGEEAYSLAMLLSEYAQNLHEPPKIQVFATDVDEDAITEAREHHYPHSIEADVSAERLKRFFVRESKYYRVKKELREMVLFAPHNVLRDPPFSRLDLIVCRNLLIYLNRETQERVMEIFHFALAPNGFVFLGSSETAEGSPDLFAPVDKKQRIYSRRPLRLTQQPTAPRMPVVGRWEVKLPEFRPNRRERAFALSEVHHKLLEKIAPPSILVSQDFDIQYISESAGRYLRFKGGEPTNNILKVIHPDLLPDLRAALFTAQREGKTAEFPNIRARIEGVETTINLIVRVVLVENEQAEYLLIILDEDKDFPLPKENESKKIARAESVAKNEAMEAVVFRLEEELARTKETLRSTIEQHEISIEELKASNEELQAINEELRSTTEELETSKEELQSVNEELTTVNHELKEKIDETSRTNSDLQNLMASTDIATIFLDKNLCIKRYTPPVEEIFNITHTDIGRPLEHFTHKLDYAKIGADAERVLQKLTPIEREISDHGNHFYLARFVPYRTLDDRIEGVVLNFVDITERKSAEVAMRESEEKFRAFVGAVSEIVYEMNADWSQMYYLRGKEFVATTENPRDDWMDEYIPDSEKARVWTAIKQAIKQKTNFELEHRVISLDGEIGWTFSRAIPIFGTQGKIVKWFGAASNITTRKRIEVALRESEERLRIAVEAAELGTWDWNLTTDEVIWNERHFTLFGLKPQTNPVHPEFFFQYVHPDDRAQVDKRLQKAIKTGKPFEAQFCAVREDGALRWMQGYGQVVEQIDGKPRRMSGVMSDITERKNAEVALRKSEESLNLILESTKDYAIITFDLKGHITRWNAGAEKIFGWREVEAVGQTTHLIFTPEDRAEGAPEKELETTLENGRAEDERWHLRKDGSRFFASGVMQVLRDGKTEGFVKIARDQTARLEAEQMHNEQEMLRRMVVALEDERRRIARDIHDHLGQQLTALRLKLESLKNLCDTVDFNDKTNAAQNIEEIIKASEQIDRDVDFIARELRPTALDDLGLRAALADFVRDWADYTGIKAEFHTSGLLRVRIGREIETNLYRIAQEALNNVQKHARASRVSVLLEKTGGKISLIIEDDGIGFNPRDKANRQKGLGLVGMIERARICGGDLEIESSTGKGTTVYARIPAKK